MSKNTCLISLFLMITLGRFDLFSQDEVYYRNLLRDQLGDQKTISQQNHFITKGKDYHFDITGDSSLETITPLKKDGSDWIEIKSANGEKLFNSKLQAHGLNAYLYKIQRVSLNKNVSVLLLFYFEGVHNYLELYRSARVYFVTYAKGKFPYRAYAAAHIAIEKELIKKQYWKRLMQVDVTDLDQDSTKEIIISYLTSQHIFKYNKLGGWKRY